MFTLRPGALEDYLSSLFGARVKIKAVGRLGAPKGEWRRELKGFGYGVPYSIEFEYDGERRSAVLETLRPGGFGHNHPSDRAQILIWQHSAFNKLSRHVRSWDVGAFTKDGALRSLGDYTEYFILTKKVEGELYHVDLDRIKVTGEISQLDVRRCLALSNYLAKIHTKKRNEPDLYVRRIRDLIGHGECIMGLTDSYPSNLPYVSEEELKEIEKRCIEWRYLLKKKVHRLSQVHGDFHPWNVLFREGVRFTLLDRSRGEWGEVADDVSSMTINYLFYSLQVQGNLSGPFEELFMSFWENYLSKTKDEEVLEVVQPFYAWRGLVVASPIWYPNLPQEVRTKLFNFIRSVLEAQRFDPEKVNSYISREGSSDEGP